MIAPSLGAHFNLHLILSYPDIFLSAEFAQISPTSSLEGDDYSPQGPQSVITFLRELVLCPAPKLWPQALEVNSTHSVQADTPEQRRAGVRDTHGHRESLVKNN